jgi:DNA repair protein SbcC/Rad50
MIENLTYAVSFPSNDISLSGDLSFQPGITAVVGRNGSGKTFAANEMVRYMLFGKKALRGPASDYKNLEGRMTVVIGGKRFTILRGKKESVADESGKLVALKAEAVTQFIVSQLGFDLDVFDVICAARQKDSERLTRLRPAERKKMIDDIVGLSQNEAVEKQCRDEAKQLRRDAETLKDTVVEAVEPVRPDAYRKSEEIFQELRAAKAVEQRRSELEKIISAVGPEPMQPVEARRSDIEELEQWEKTRIEGEARYNELRRRIDAIPELDFTEEQLDNAEAWLDFAEEVDRRGPPPTLERAAVEAEIEQWHRYNALKDQERHEVDCPKCSHIFLTGLPVPDQPTTPLRVLTTELAAIEAWAEPLVEPEGPSIIGFATRKEVVAARAALAKQDEKRQLEAEIGSLVLLNSKDHELVQARRVEAQWEAFLEAQADWNERVADAEDARQELATLPAPVDVDALNEAFTDARVYETQHEAYLVAKKREDELTATIVEKLAKAESYKEGAEALKRTRATFKAFLAPSLGRVASAFISQMTGGKFDSVIVDEEMNIAVNGQDVSTMSGAQATLANLALRLALGQILTAKVFPVFLGDEIDSDCDDEWAPLVAEALGRLKSQLKQIILISHKQFDWADHHVKIGESSELVVD